MPLLDTFVFAPSGDTWQLERAAQMENWRLAQHRVATHYWLAVAWNGPSPAPTLRLVPVNPVVDLLKPGQD